MWPYPYMKNAMEVNSDRKFRVESQNHFTVNTDILPASPAAIM